jgi:hypothetical protein
MDMMGHRDFARRGLEFFIARYNDAGFLTTGYTMMGTGWHLWMLGEHYQLTKDKQWLLLINQLVTQLHGPGPLRVERLQHIVERFHHQLFMKQQEFMMLH